ncbi:MAG: site-specific integrase [Algicola sp.]|nr:site-specific integrase [Algicola sp.]
MLLASIFVDTRRKTKKGYPVKLQIYCTISQKRKYISLKQYQKSKTKITAEAQEALSKLLVRIEPVKHLPIDDVFVQLQKESDLEVWAMRKKLDEHIAFIDFYEFTDELIKEREIEGKKTENLKAAKREVKSYMGENPFGLNDITYKWAVKYRLHKLKSGTKEGGISYYLRSMRIIHNEAKRRMNLEVKQTEPFKGLIKNIPSPEHQAKRWNIGDVKSLLHFEHPNATKATKRNMQRAIDIFMFQIHIGGHDFIDVANLKWDNIQNGRLVFKRFKNRNKAEGGRTVDNMLSAFALKVIEKHGDKESDRVFSFLPDPNTDKYTHRLYGATLKRISKVMGIKPHFSTKTPRYIFRTIAGNLLIHDLVVESLLGHKPTSINHKYQRGLPNEVKDTEHQKILDELTIMSQMDKLVRDGKWIRAGE